jgi:hypothetical protein
MRLGKKLGGNMTVMLPPAGMGDAAVNESVAVLPEAPGKRSLAAIVKATLEICCACGAVALVVFCALAPVRHWHAKKQTLTMNNSARPMLRRYGGNDGTDDLTLNL